MTNPTVDGCARDVGPRPPTLSLGLPVYNGERFLAASLDALLAQTYGDFELIVADNASTDATAAIVARYAEADPRVRSVRHPRNLGLSYNHNSVVREARGTYFKWVSHDDLYAPELLERCMEAMLAHPGAACAHAWTALIDEQGEVVSKVDYPLRTDGPSPVERFRSLLHTQGGDDIYGIIPMSVLGRMAPLGTHYLADRTFVAELALQGPFVNVPEHLFYRRRHPSQLSARGRRSVRASGVGWDPARAGRRHPAVRLIGEYLLAYVTAIRNAPLSSAERRQCYRELASWVLGHTDRLTPDELRRILGSGRQG